jgi:small subunit ribosomal protein S14
MSKLSLKQRELKREKLVEQFSRKYAELQAIARDAKRSDEQRYAARLEIGRAHV